LWLVKNRTVNPQIARGAWQGFRSNCVELGKSDVFNFKAVIQYAAMQNGFNAASQLSRAQILSKYNAEQGDSKFGARELRFLCGAKVNSR
jgi:hypothetical protein